MKIYSVTWNSAACLNSLDKSKGTTKVNNSICKLFPLSRKKLFSFKNCFFPGNLYFSMTLPSLPAMCELCHRENALQVPQHPLGPAQLTGFPCSVFYESIKPLCHQPCPQSCTGTQPWPSSHPGFRSPPRSFLHPLIHCRDVSVPPHWLSSFCSAVPCPSATQETCTGLHSMEPCLKEKQEGFCCSLLQRECVCS